MRAVKSLKETREIVYDRLFETLQSTEFSKSMEKAIADYTSKRMKEMYVHEPIHWCNKTTRRLYLRKYRSILYNIRNVYRLLKEGVSANDIVHMKYYEIDSERWSNELNVIKNREIASLVAYTDDVYDGLLLCFQCKSYKTRYTTLQTRSGDEATTVYARCLTCGFTWTE
jgi:DNA-directed RNA polymerase subunit M/transcription elongation factor TFIIS